MDWNDTGEIKVALEKLGLQSYFQLFNNRKISTERFENLTKEDLKVMGIENETDQTALLNFLRGQTCNDLLELPALNILKLLQDINHQLLRLIINVQIIERRLIREPDKYYDCLINPTTTSSQGIFTFIQLALAELQSMENNYLLKAIKAQHLKKQRSWKRNRVIGVTVLALTTLAGFLYKFKIKNLNSIVQHLRLYGYSFFHLMY